MVFSSNLFLFGFLPAFLALYYTIPVRGRAVLIAVASYLFYGWWRVDFVSLMWLSTVLDYACGHRIAAIRAGGRGDARRWLLVSVIANLGLLAYFKYCNFGIDNLNVLLAGLGFEGVDWPRVVLPVGISFYTFQTMSYTIDVYRGDARPVRSFGDFMCYVALFPQLVAGPIVRYQDVADQLVERTHSLDKFGEGARRFMVGFCKKVLVADSVAHIAEAAFALPHPNFADAWLGALAYTVQLYFDFSGYSDMAIGLGLMIGFRFVENFDQPYRSHSITEFWQRWHISLSTWLRDYLYVPLGGNRHGERRTYVNLALVMLLGGLWHGANWTFVAWGAWHGGLLAIERRLGTTPTGERARFRYPVPLLMLFVVIGWVMFRADSVSSAVRFYGAMVMPDALSLSDAMRWQVSGWGIFVLGLSFLLLYMGPRVNSRAAVASGETEPPILKNALLWVPLFLLAVLRLSAQSYTPFLYFQF